MSKLTHGEHIFLKRQNLDFTQSMSRMQQSISARIPPRMEYQEAMQYYKNKLNKVWENMK